MELNELILKIKQKKELSGLPDSFLLPIAEKIIRKYHLALEKITKSELSIVVKETRAELRKYVGRFHSSNRDRIDLLRSKNIDELLKIHSSTKERVSFYPELISILKKMNVQSILDLGCGINPIALAKHFKEYHAYDINENDIALVNEFFKMQGINGTANVKDIRQDFIYPLADACLIFKVLDIIEEKGHKIADTIISKLNSKYLLISFATRTLSGKKMQYSQRGWMEKILFKYHYDFKKIESDNELFYLAYPKNTPAPV
ncbi:MAG: hypothetical protein WCK90_05445 [archaeon]